MDTLNLFSDLDDELGRLEQSAPAQLWNASTINDLKLAERAKSIVPGLDYIPDFITRDEELELVRQIDAMDWNNHWQRRTQYYGRKYLPSPERGMSESGRGAGGEGIPGDEPDEHRARARDRRLASGTVDHLPWWSMKYRERLVERGIFVREPNQMGINEYLPGQGIAPHVDYHGGEVVSITLITGCVMDFERVESSTHADRERLMLFGPESEGGEPRVYEGPSEASTWLPPRSMVILKGEARSLWTHGIARRKKDIVDGRVIPRGRRISLTFRCI